MRLLLVVSLPAALLAAAAPARADVRTAGKPTLLRWLAAAGDLERALRAAVRRTERRNRRGARMLARQQSRVREARSRVLRAMGRPRPPRARRAPSRALRDRDLQARYTRFVQVSTQLLGELQQTERELWDALQAARRAAQTFWESYGALRDSAYRSNERVMRTR